MAVRTSAMSKTPRVEHSSFLSMLDRQSDQNTSTSQSRERSYETALEPSAKGRRKSRNYLTSNDSGSDSSWDDWNDVRGSKKRERPSSESDSDEENFSARSDSDAGSIPAIGSEGPSTYRPVTAAQLASDVQGSPKSDTLDQRRKLSLVVRNGDPNLDGTPASQLPLQSVGNRMASSTNSYKFRRLVNPQNALISEPVQDTAAITACKRCNAGHFRCDRGTPKCTKCEEDGAECSYVDERGTEDRACKRCNVRHLRCDRAAPICTKCQEDGAECSYLPKSRTEESLHLNATALPDTTDSGSKRSLRSVNARSRNSLRTAGSESESDVSESNAKNGPGKYFDRTSGGFSTSSGRTTNLSTILPFDQAPQAVKATLRLWFLSHGRRKELPCAVRSGDRKQHIVCSREGVPVRYAFRDGKSLLVEMYRLPKETVSGFKDSIIVATARSGDNLIISFKESRQDETLFQIWQGISATGVNGFERSPSVVKWYSSEEGSLSKSPEGTERNASGATKRTAPKTPVSLKTPPVRSTENRITKTAKASDTTLVPRNWDHALEISRKGGVTAGKWSSREEECARKHLQVPIDNSRPQWIWFYEVSTKLRAEGVRRDANSVKQMWHYKIKSKRNPAAHDLDDPDADNKDEAKDDDEAEAKAEDEPEGNDEGKEEAEEEEGGGNEDRNEDKDVERDLSESATKNALGNPSASSSKPEVSGPLGKQSSSTQAKWSRTEKDRIIKHLADVNPQKDLKGIILFQEVSRRLKVEDIRLTPGQVKNFWYRERRNIARIQEKTPAPSRVVSLQKEASTSPELRRSVSKDASLSQPPQSSARTPTSAKLNEHILDHVVCIFQNQRGKPPRVRPFRSCDSTEDLFAQAQVGEVFGDERRRVNRLTISFGNNVTMPTMNTLNLVENDEQDFETLKQMIMDVGWFYESDGVIRGSGTLEVRAMT